MSLIQELLKKYCSGGVPFRRTGDVCNIFTGGEPPEDCVKGVPPHDGCVYPVFSNGINGNELYGYSSFYTIGEEAVTFSSIGTIGHPQIREAGFTPIIRLKVLIPKKDSELRLRFLKYALEIAKFRQQASSVPNINAKMISNIRIPVPPLEVQDEIVRILDNFTELTKELTAELKAELTARKKQYKFYLNSLLNFGEDTPRYRVGDLFEFKNGLSKGKEYFGKGNCIVKYTDVYRSNRITRNLLSDRVECNQRELDSLGVHRGDIFFTRTSETREEVGIASVMLDEVDDCVFSGFLLRARPTTNLLLPEYCAYCFASDEIRSYITSATPFTTRASLSGTILSQMKIAVPPIEKQREIAALLDMLESMVNGINEGLPAEIAVRQKQYEYYRHRLLSFKELPS